MKIRAQIQTWLLTALLIGWGCLMVGCSDHADDEKGRQDEQKSVPFTVASLTRSGDETTGTALYSYDGMSIQLFLVPQDATAGEETLKGQAVYSGEGLPWITTIGVKSSAQYKVFGFMPAGISANDEYSVTISDNTATLTIPQMLTVSDKDVCVITGVKDHPLNVSENEKVLPGVFDYTANPVGGEYGVSLLAEHIYAAVEVWFKMKANIAYNNLRTIKLKKVILKNAQTAIVKTTIPLTIGNSETSVPNPIGEITMEEVESTVVAEATLFSSAAGEELMTTDGSEIKVPGYFTLGNNHAAGLEIESVYDVYDNDVLVREDCHAVNKINGLVGSLKRGDKKIIKIIVNPTYLYVLSDDDSGNIGVATTTGD